MLPIGTSTTTYIIQPPLVNTTTPATSVVPVPYDNVAPSLSGSQVDNNTNSNNTPAAPTEEQTVATTDNAANQAALTTTQSGTADSINSGAQAPFIAQLAGQDNTQEATLALLQYEKLIEYSNVKYEPSYAFKPPPGPSGVFGSLLASAKAAAANTQTVSQPVQPQPSATPSTTSAAPLDITNVNVTAAPTTADVLPTDVTQSAQGAPETDTILSTQPAPVPQDNSTPALQLQATPTPQPIILPTVTAASTQASDLAINAYIASASRVAFQSAETTGALA